LVNFKYEEFHNKITKSEITSRLVNRGQEKLSIDKKQEEKNLVVVTPRCLKC
jgi:hypothetical protein